MTGMPTSSNVLLKLRVVEAKGLAKKDTFGKSDPFTKVFFLGCDSKPETRRTLVRKKTLNPKWNHDFRFKIRCHHDKGTIVLDVYDENKLIRDDFLGRVYLHFDLDDPESLYYFEKGTQYSRQYKLVEKHSAADFIDTTT